MAAVFEDEGIEDKANEDNAEGNDAVSTDGVDGSESSVPDIPISESTIVVEISLADDIIILPDSDDEDINMYDRPNCRATVLSRPTIPTPFAGHFAVVGSGHGSNVNALPLPFLTEPRRPTFTPLQRWKYENRFPVILVCVTMYLTRS
ncbi:hypothetical protein M758_UG046000 [Ceratodon purpureus]|nr:hypothetical protein M758_UG046000 [Ceratodon purpureus]